MTDPKQEQPDPRAGTDSLATGPRLEVELLAGQTSPIPVLHASLSSFKPWVFFASVSEHTASLAQGDTGEALDEVFNYLLYKACAPTNLSRHATRTIDALEQPLKQGIVPLPSSGN